MRKYIIVLLLITYSLSVTIVLFITNEKVSSLNQTLQVSETEYLKTIEETNNHPNILEETISKLKEERKTLIDRIEDQIIINGATIQRLKYNGINDYNIISDDLLLRPELIPYEGVLGGTMQFSKVFVLNDKWVYASFEDGHIQGFGLYGYTIDNDKNISWKVIDYNLDGNEN